MAEKILQISPSALSLFLECQGCFWLEKNYGIKRPSPYPYSLNSAVDDLLKEEFDACRHKNIQPPLLEQNNIKAKLFPSQRLVNQWRNGKTGIRYYDKKLQATLFGAPDDALEFAGGKVAPFDYKSTAEKPEKVFDAFQLQLDTYAFLFEKNGYKICRKAYMAFYIIDKNSGFIDRLPFKKKILEVETNPSDICNIFKDSIECLRQEDAPAHSQDCQFGKYFKKLESFNSKLKDRI